MDRQENMLKNMELLIGALHKEWERSGKTCAAVSVPIEEGKAVNDRLIRVILENTKNPRIKEMDFAESLAFSKKNFVLLRLVKKVKKAEDKANRRGQGMEFRVELDREEYMLFRKIMEIREV